MVNTHPQMLDEVLDKINESVPGEVLKSLQDAYKIPYLREYMTFAVSDEWTTILLEEVEVKKYNYHRSMAGAYMMNRQTHNIIANVLMTKEVKNPTKIIQFRALSEMLFSVEANILKHILTKNLTELYPNITHDLIVESLN